MILQMSMEKSYIWFNVRHLSQVNTEMMVDKRRGKIDKAGRIHRDRTTALHALRYMGMQCIWVPCQFRQRL